jgi:hypothetical protein
VGLLLNTEIMSGPTAIQNGPEHLVPSEGPGQQSRLLHVGEGSIAYIHRIAAKMFSWKLNRAFKRIR